MTAFKALTLGVLGWPDRALGHHPVIEVPAIQLLRDPMQENPERFLLTLPMLPVFADPSSFPQSDVLTPVVRLQPNTGASKTPGRFFVHRESVARRLAVDTTHHPTWLHHSISERATAFSGILPTTVRPGQATVLRQEIRVTPIERGYRRITPNSEEVRFLQPVFCCTQKRWWFTSDSRLASLESPC